MLAASAFVFGLASMRAVVEWPYTGTGPRARRQLPVDFGVADDSFAGVVAALDKHARQHTGAPRPRTESSSKMVT